MQNGQGYKLTPAVYAYLGYPNYINIPHEAFNSLSFGATNYVPNSIIAAAENHPQAASTYKAVPETQASFNNPNGVLFGTSQQPSFLHVQQGCVGDCWLLASLAEVAARAPSNINDMFTFIGTGTENGDLVGFYSVRFFNNQGAAKYVYVDTELPGGGTYYDRVNTALGNKVLWVALAEKAYVQASSFGFVSTSVFSLVGNDYGVVNGGYPSWALQAITGKSASDHILNSSSSYIVSDWNAGKFVVITTPSSDPVSSKIVGWHAYALVGYNPSSSQPFTVFNPWGTTCSGWAPYTYKGNQVYGLFTSNWAFLWQNFYGESNGSGATAGMANHGTSSQQLANAPFVSQNCTGESLGSGAAAGMADSGSGSQQFADLGGTFFSAWAPSPFKGHRLHDPINAYESLQSQSFDGREDNWSQEDVDPWSTNFGCLLNGK